MMAKSPRNRRSPTVAPVVAAIAASLFAAASATGAEQGDPSRGAPVFRTCAACHSLQIDKNMTGPSLAGLWDRKAGSLASFTRYSPALKSSEIIWNAQTLDPWLKEPQHFIPGNRMTFAGVADDRARHDLIAFLKQATTADHPVPSPSVAQNDGMGGMMGGSQTVPNLKKLGPGDRVTAIAYCGDTYRVTTGDGETHEFWERNLRFKTDASSDGPEKNTPAILGAGMMGDRVSIIFATPEEISASVKRNC
jgi:cytochrome c